MNKDELSDLIEQNIDLEADFENMKEAEGLYDVPNT